MDYIGLELWDLLYRVYWCQIKFKSGWVVATGANLQPRDHQLVANVLPESHAPIGGGDLRFL